MCPASGHSVRRTSVPENEPWSRPQESQMPESEASVDQKEYEQDTELHGTRHHLRQIGAYAFYNDNRLPLP